MTRVSKRALRENLLDSACAGMTNHGAALIMFNSLEDKLKGAPGLLAMFRNAPTGFYEFPVPDEHTNWRDEQHAWRDTAVLFDQSYHMTDVHIKGPDRIRLLSDISVNNYENFGPMKAAQFVACTDAGHIIGDAILFHLQDGSISLIGKPPAGNWVTFVAETGGYDVEVVRDERVPDGGGRRLTYRFQVQGPHAYRILEKANRGPLPETRFFGMCEFSIGGHRVTALRHGMAGAPGMEFWGPYDERQAVREALMAAGEEFGLKAGGARVYSTAGPESGWVGSVMPAIYEGDEMKAYREWLPADGFEGTLSIGGSLVCDEIAGYYMDPWDLGYHRLIHWEHEFKGRAALLEKRDEKHRKKVWLRWNGEDVLKVMGSMFTPGQRYKYLETPAAHYATIPYDKVEYDGKPIGLSVYAAYTVNANSWFSIGIINEDDVEYGKEVVLTWGEPEGVTGKLTVEPHVQTEIRAIASETAMG